MNKNQKIVAEMVFIVLAALFLNYMVFVKLPRSLAIYGFSSVGIIVANGYAVLYLIKLALNIQVTRMYTHHLVVGREYRYRRNNSVVYMGYSDYAYTFKRLDNSEGLSLNNAQVEKKIREIYKIDPNDLVVGKKYYLYLYGSVKTRVIGEYTGIEYPPDSDMPHYAFTLPDGGYSRPPLDSMQREVRPLNWQDPKI
jgi:hypothetical protein